MNRKLLAGIAAFFLLPCCGCTSVKHESSADSAAEAIIETTISSNRMTASAETGTTAIETDSLTASDDAQSLSEADATTLFQGGIGLEKDAATPKPEFFSYRFQPDAFTARLAGGNYQTVLCDLSEAMQHQIDTEYYLSDYDSDGCFDLYLPTSYDGEVVRTYWVFLWNPTDEKFLTEPISVGAAS